MRSDPAFDDFVVSRSPALLRTSIALCGGDRHAGEDLLQTALLKLARNWRRAADHPEPYVRRTLVTLVIDDKRTRRRRPREHAWPDGLDVAAPSESTTSLLPALAELPPQQRATLVLRFWDDQSVAQTAALLGTSEGTVKSNTSRGLAKLRDVLERTQHADR